MTASIPLNFTHTVTERFLRYVVIDTQSDPASPTCPSTEKQKDLGRLLATELREIGLSDAHLDDNGYVYATIPANTDKQVPVICFCSHMDTHRIAPAPMSGRKSSATTRAATSSCRLIPPR
jgi:tripeptide aminopeptidase